MKLPLPRICFPSLFLFASIATAGTIAFEDSSSSTSVTSTDSGVTVTVTIDQDTAFGGDRVIDITGGGGFGGTTGSFLYLSNFMTTATTMTFSFSQAVSITSFRFVEVEDRASGTYTFTPNSGTALAMAATDENGSSGTTISSASGIGNLNQITTWTNVTSFTYTYTGGTPESQPGFDTIVFGAAAPTVTDANISISGASGTGGAYKIGDTVTATWNNTAGGDNNSGITGVTVDFTSFGGGAAVAASNSSSTWTATYTITAGAVDATNRNVSVSATNAGTSTTTADSTNATVDSVAPTVSDANISISGATGTGGAYKIGDTVTATWNNTAGGDNNSDTISSVSVNFSQFGGGAAVAATNSSGTWTATYTIVAGAIDASNRNVSVTATDNAGNTTTTADSTNATVSNVAPAAPSAPDLAAGSDTGSSSTDNLTSTTTPTLTGTAAADATVKLYDTDGTTELGTATATGGNWSIASSALGAGAHTLTAKTTDAIGNVSAASAGLSITIDIAAPTLSTITRQTPTTVNTTATSVTYRATFNEAVTGVDISDFTLSTVSGTAAGTIAAVSAATGTMIDVTVNAITGEGQLRLDLKATGTALADAAGNALADGGFTSGNLYVVGNENVFDATSLNLITTLPVAGSNSNSAAQRFTTAAANPLSLTGISIRVATINGTPVPEVTIRTDNSGAPSATVVGTFTNPSSLTANALNIWTGSVTLAPSTTYWAYIRDTSAGSSFEVDVSTATVGGSGSWLNSPADYLFRYSANAQTSQTGAVMMALGAASNPTITSVTGPANGSYKEGSNLSFTANFSEAVNVTGTPRIAITLGGSTLYATYASGSGTTALVFTYAVQEEDTDTDGIAAASPLQLNGGTIRNGDSQDATLTFAPPNTAAVLVDTTAPVITSGATATASYGNAFNSYTITATDSATISYGATGLPAGLSVHSGTGAITGTPTAGGLTTATLSATDAAGNVSTKSLAFTVNQAASNITWNAPAAIIYGTALSGVQLSATANIAGSFAYSPAAGTVLDAGAGQTLSVTFTPDDTDSYTTATGSVALTVAQRAITVTASSGQGKVYGSSDPILGYAITSGSLAGSDSLSGSLARAAGENVGAAYTIGQGTLTAGANYELTFIPANFAITKKALAVTADNKARSYQAPNPTLTATITGFAFGDTAASSVTGSAALSTSATSDSPAGSYAITVTIGTLAAANYSFAFVDGALEVGKLGQTIDFGELGAKQPNAADFNLSATATSGLDVVFTLVSGSAILNGNTVTLTGAAGTVTIRADQAGDATYAAAPSVTRSFEVAITKQQVYFGNGSDGSTFAAVIIPPPEATQKDLPPKPHTAIYVKPTGIASILNFFVNPDNSITPSNTTQLEGAPKAKLSSTLSNPLRPRLNADPIEYPFTGTLINGQLTIHIAEFDLTLTATVEPADGPTAELAGLYEASSLNSASGGITSIVGTTGKVFIIATSPGLTTGGQGVISSAGEFIITTPDNVILQGGVDAPSTAISGTIILPSGEEEDFLGLSEQTPRANRLIAFSGRAFVDVASGADLITGFAITGTQSKRVLLRAVGPALSEFGVGNPVADPRATLYNGAGQVVAEFDDWAGDPEVAAAIALTGTAPLGSASLDAAAVVELAPGNYAVRVANKTAPGVALAEIYDASENPDSQGPRLIGLSTRGKVSAGERALIGGFIVTGNSPKRVLVHGVGPGLAPYGVPGFLPNPKIQVYNASGQVLAANDDWQVPMAILNGPRPATSDEIADANTATGSTPYAEGSADAALVITLSPGAYSVILSSATAQEGTALIEVYDIPGNE